MTHFLKPLSFTLLTSLSFAVASAKEPSSSVIGQEKPAIVLNQHLAEGWHSHSLDLKDTDALFATVFAQLPEQVTVYPTENYFYWKLFVDGREIYGNIRLPSGRRENGVLSFGYSEFVEFPSSPYDEAEIQGAKYFTKADGVIVTCPDKFTSTVEFRGKKVTFHFNKLPQTPPTQFQLGPDEKFIMRCWDESSMQFFLLFNTKKNYFIWVLNEEDRAPDHFKPLQKDIVVGRRTGFVFWVDEKQQNRKVLATIRKLSVMRNDYFDGPFDQLADNYADEQKIREHIELAIPSFKGRIDKYGYFTDSETPSRVALSNYGNYYTFAEAIQFIENAKKAKDPYYYISRGGMMPPGEDADTATPPKTTGEPQPTEPPKKEK
jgi:hypothetical protein